MYNICLGMCITQQLIFLGFRASVYARLCVCVCACWCVHNMRVCVCLRWQTEQKNQLVGELESRPSWRDQPTNHPSLICRHNWSGRPKRCVAPQINPRHRQRIFFPFIPCKIIKYIPRSWIMDCSYLNQKQQRRRTKTHEFVWHAWARSAQFDQSMKKKQANAGSGQKFLKKRPLYIVFRTESSNFQK